MLNRGDYGRVILIGGDITNTYCYRGKIVRKPKKKWLKGIVASYKKRRVVKVEKKKARSILKFFKKKIKFEKKKIAKSIRASRKVKRKETKKKIKVLKKEVRSQKLKLWKRQGYYGTAHLEAEIRRLKGEM